MRRRRITFRAIDRDGMVRLPQIFWLYLAFRSTFPRALPMRQLYSFVVLGPLAMVRLGAFDAEWGDRTHAEVRRREQLRIDADWEACA